MQLRTSRRRRLVFTNRVDPFVVKKIGLRAGNAEFVKLVQERMPRTIVAKILECSQTISCTPSFFDSSTRSQISSLRRIPEALDDLVFKAELIGKLAELADAVD